MEVRNTQYTIYYLSFSSFSSCLVFSELTQASECLWLTAAKGSDPSLFPSLFRFLAFGVP